MAASRELLHAAHRRINAALAPCGLHMHEYLALRLLSDSVHEPLRPTSLGMALDATRLEQAVPLLLASTCTCGSRRWPWRRRW